MRGERTVGVMTPVALRRWGLVGLLLALVVAVPAVSSAWPASPDETPPPAVLRDRIAGSADQPFSGDAESSGGMRFPRIAEFSDLTSLTSGTTRMRAWYAGPAHQRVDQLSPTGERDRYTTPEGQVVWDYGSTMLTLVGRDPTVRLPRPEDLLPPQLARRLLAGTAATDPVSALPARRVADHDVPGVRVTVGDPRTSVAALDLWADPHSGLPLAVDVLPRGGGPAALSTRFGRLTEGPPDPGALAPRRGPGTGLTRSPTSDLFGVLGRGDPRLVPRTLDGVRREPTEPGFGAIGQYGTSLSQIVAVPLAPAFADPLLRGVSTAGSGGHPVALDQPDARGAALSSPLLSMAVVRRGDRGWAVSGLVAPEVLDRAARDLVNSSADPASRRSS